MSFSFGTIVPYTKFTQPHTKACARRRWTEKELEILSSHPDMTSTELSELLPGRTSMAVRHMRMRHGRYIPQAQLCSICTQRVVWTNSTRAKTMGLCKGCYLHEMENRDREDKRANALRQSLLKERRRKC